MLTLTYALCKKPLMLGAIMLNVIMLNVVMLSVIILNVVAPVFLAQACPCKARPLNWRLFQTHLVANVIKLFTAISCEFL